MQKAISGEKISSFQIIALLIPRLAILVFVRIHSKRSEHGSVCANYRRCCTFVLSLWWPPSSPLSLTPISWCEYQSTFLIVDRQKITQWVTAPLHNRRGQQRLATTANKLLEDMLEVKPQSSSWRIKWHYWGSTEKRKSSRCFPIFLRSLPTMQS